MLGLLSRFVNTLYAKKKKAYLDKLVKNGLRLGDNVDIVADFFLDPSHCYLISIGDNTTFAPNVRLIAHDASIKKHLGYSKMGKIDIGRNCFLGDSVIVLPNVRIGDNSIIGAGSVVTKDIPERSIAAGNPAKVLCGLDKYLEKIKVHKADKKLFGADYHIGALTEAKRAEILQALDNDIGYID